MLVCYRFNVCSPGHAIARKLRETCVEIGNGRTPMSPHLELITEIDGQSVPRERVLHWELVRLTTVLKSLGAPVTPDDSDVDDLRSRLFDLKRIIGPRELQRRLRPKLALSTTISRLAVRASRGRRVQSSIKVQVPSGTAEGFAEWFTSQSALPTSDAMLAACPDHYVIGEDSSGRQKVIETTGGAPLPSEFFIDYTDVSSLAEPASPLYPIQIAGVARTADGLPIGGVRHQFRDLEGGGFESWNTVEFPSVVGSRIVHGHRWHLACEFGNWIEFQQLVR